MDTYQNRRGMKIAIGTDHGAIDYKNSVIDYLKQKGNQVVDFGTDSKESCDYTDFAVAVAQDVANKNCDFGILMCGTGIGMSLAANKVKGIRAAVVPNVDYARLSKEHNNANIICLSGRYMTLQECFDCIDAYMNAEFAGNSNDQSGLRHARRVNKISEIESVYFK